jgi:2-C-methyl-D-erythritol 4-phosphate cytidylyltransferase
MKTQAIIPAAGEGSRLKAESPKPFIRIKGRSILGLTLRAFEASPLIDSVVLVAPLERMGEFENLVKSESLKKVSRIVAGGKTRRASVYNGLQVIDHDTQIVAVHDAARPLLDQATLEAAVTAAQVHKAVVVGVPVKPTIKRVDAASMAITETIERNGLWEIQTPQVFDKELLQKAHASNPQLEASDDALLVERLGADVKIIEGTYRNIKITTAEDLTVAAAFLSEGMQP